jgi:hypothetical protein
MWDTCNDALNQAILSQDNLPFTAENYAVIEDTWLAHSQKAKLFETLIDVFLSHHVGYTTTSSYLQTLFPSDKYALKVAIITALKNSGREYDWIPTLKQMMYWAEGSANYHDELRETYRAVLLALDEDAICQTILEELQSNQKEWYASFLGDSTLQNRFSVMKHLLPDNPSYIKEIFALLDLEVAKGAWDTVLVILEKTSKRFQPALSEYISIHHPFLQALYLLVAMQATPQFLNQALGIALRDKNLYLAQALCCLLKENIEAKNVATGLHFFASWKGEPSLNEIKLLCGLKGDNKPSSDAISRALESTNSSQVICILSRLREENKPSPEAIERTLLTSLNRDSRHPLMLLCNLTTENNRASESLKKALLSAVEIRAWRHVAWFFEFNAVTSPPFLDLPPNVLIPTLDAWRACINALPSERKLSFLVWGGVWFQQLVQTYPSKNWGCLPNMVASKDWCKLVPFYKTSEQLIHSLGGLSTPEKKLQFLEAGGAHFKTLFQNEIAHKLKSSVFWHELHNNLKLNQARWQWLLDYLGRAWFQDLLGSAEDLHSFFLAYCVISPFALADLEQAIAFLTPEHIARQIRQHANGITLLGKCLGSLYFRFIEAKCAPEIACIPITLFLDKVLLPFDKAEPVFSGNEPLWTLCKLFMEYSNPHAIPLLTALFNTTLFQQKITIEELSKVTLEQKQSSFLLPALNARILTIEPTKVVDSYFKTLFQKGLKDKKHLKDRLKSPSFWHELHSKLELNPARWQWLFDYLGSAWFQDLLGSAKDLHSFFRTYCQSSPLTLANLEQAIAFLTPEHIARQIRQDTAPGKSMGEMLVTMYSSFLNAKFETKKACSLVPLFLDKVILPVDTVEPVFSDSKLLWDIYELLMANSPLVHEEHLTVAFFNTELFQQKIRLVRDLPEFTLSAESSFLLMKALDPRILTFVPKEADLPPLPDCRNYMKNDVSYLRGDYVHSDVSYYIACSYYMARWKQSIDDFATSQHFNPKAKKEVLLALTQLQTSFDKKRLASKLSIEKNRMNIQFFSMLTEKIANPTLRISSQEFADAFYNLNKQMVDYFEQEPVQPSAHAITGALILGLLGLSAGGVLLIACVATTIPFLLGSASFGFFALALLMAAISSVITPPIVGAGLGFWHGKRAEQKQIQAAGNKHTETEFEETQVLQIRLGVV